jgi:hypothetical protein
VEDTVKLHLKNIFSKLKVTDRTQAVVSAAQRGFIDLHTHTHTEGIAGVKGVLERAT